jgi:hypothetical protein
MAAEAMRRPPPILDLILLMTNAFRLATHADGARSGSLHGRGHPMVHTQRLGFGGHAMVLASILLEPVP